VFALADVVYFLADELSRLRRCRLALAGIFFGSLDSFALWHGQSPPESQAIHEPDSKQSDFYGI
jgi:hypothetical protein